MRIIASPTKEQIDAAWARAQHVPGPDATVRFDDRGIGMKFDALGDSASSWGWFVTEDVGELSATSSRMTKPESIRRAVAAMEAFTQVARRPRGRS